MIFFYKKGGLKINFSPGAKKKEKSPRNPKYRQKTPFLKKCSGNWSFETSSWILTSNRFFQCISTYRPDAWSSYLGLLLIVGITESLFHNNYWWRLQGTRSNLAFMISKSNPIHPSPIHQWCAPFSSFTITTTLPFHMTGAFKFNCYSIEQKFGNLFVSLCLCFLIISSNTVP